MCRKFLLALASATLVSTLYFTPALTVCATDDDDVVVITDSEDTNDDDDEDDDDEEEEENNHNKDLPIDPEESSDTEEDYGVDASDYEDDSDSDNNYVAGGYDDGDDGDDGDYHVRDNTPETADISINPKFILAGSILLGGLSLLIFGRRITFVREQDGSEPYDDSLD